MTSEGQKAPLATPSQLSQPAQPRQLTNARHPRRAPANRSVSLLHSQDQKNSRRHNSSSDGSAASQSNNTPSSIRAVGGIGSSGDSSNVDNWFDESNNKVRQDNGSFVNNDDSPYFLRNSSSSETPPDIQRQRVALTGGNDQADSSLLRAGLLNLKADGETAEDFRSVIDDLTVENKKLKRKLKKYEKLHDSHLKDEKLFELRVHGLPADRKMELEETLRKFASSIGSKQANAFVPDGYTNIPLNKNAGKASPLPPSFRNADSAYASMSTPGTGSSAQSGEGKQTTPTDRLESRQSNIHDYLHHIPESLLPQQNPTVMSDHAKQKLVVRRMEQIFVGKGAELEAHQQSLQQQEVSRMAAKADTSVEDAAGLPRRHEGVREANIMDRETEDPTDSKQSTEQPHESALGGPSIPGYPTAQDVANRRSIQKVQTDSEQRPTRPLDLDLNRAQVPADNIRYIRHLGFTSGSGPSTPPPDGRGWIYLNLLMNMAQLHTINVTLEFVRTALSDYSDHFELSEDGRKVKWKGGASITRTSSSDEHSSHDRIGNDTVDVQRPRKRVRLSHDDSSRLKVSDSSQRLRSEPPKHLYTPFFSHSDGTSETNESSTEEQQTSESSVPMFSGPESRGVSSVVPTSAGPAPATKKKSRKANDGPIIFYNNGRFCTDLSGDRKGRSGNTALSYNVATRHPIGKELSSSSRSLEKRGPLASAAVLPEPINISENSIPDSGEIFISPEPPPSPSHRLEKVPQELEATGIGGVWPADNFTISVESRHVHIDDPDELEVAKRVAPYNIPRRFTQLLSSSEMVPKRSTAVQSEVVSSNLQNLPPSGLPPALSFVSPDHESSNEDISEEDDDLLSGMFNGAVFPPSTAPQPVDFAYDFYNEGDDEDEAEDESDEEVDFLAAARELDPEAIREKEREYDADMAERLAEEIPAGNSAATNEGGSGFVSPADGINREEYERAAQAGRTTSSNWRRATSHDSMEVGKSDASDDEMSDVGS